MSFDCQSCGGWCAYSRTRLKFLEEDTCDGNPGGCAIVRPAG